MNVSDEPNNLWLLTVLYTLNSEHEILDNLKKSDNKDDIDKKDSTITIEAIKAK